MQLELIGNVVKETLRMRPPVGLTSPRKCARDGVMLGTHPFLARPVHKTIAMTSERPCGLHLAIIQVITSYPLDSKRYRPYLR